MAIEPTVIASSTSLPFNKPMFLSRFNNVNSIVGFSTAARSNELLELRLSVIETPPSDRLFPVYVGPFLILMV